MSELALYRKYRSNDFSEVVGQDHVVQTLQKAVATGRASHAYLLTGPRGVGKTSVARILARALNCAGKPKPCGKCQFCQADLAGNLDIIEIDGASNRGIDEIRDLREKINLAPSVGQYKIYIIDEVHMLTEAAFNALLKTLEEPPAHVVFVFATTEAHKIPATIISRTQRFNFHAIAPELIAKHLNDVAKREQITASPEAIELIAHAADGSFRDGLSLLDQLSALGSDIGVGDVQSLLGWGDAKEVERLGQLITGGPAAAALELADRLLDQGAQPLPLINQLIESARQKLRHSIQKQLPTNDLVDLLESLITATKSPLPEFALEAAIARVAKVASDPAEPPIQLEPAPAPVVKTPSPTAPTPVAPASGAMDKFEERWLKALAAIKAKNNSLYALLCSCGTNYTEGGIEVLARFSFHRDRVLEPKNLQIIEKAVEQAFGRKIPVFAKLQAEPSTAKSADPTTELVSSALEILGGEVVE